MSITNEDIISVIQENLRPPADTSESDADGLRAVARALSILWVITRNDPLKLRNLLLLTIIKTLNSDNSSVFCE